MRIEIEFDTDSEPFFKAPYGEPARLVSAIALLINVGKAAGRLSDANGKDVGTWAVTEQ
jgi:hypothetical protein